MAPTYLADRYGWAYSLDDGGQPKYLLNGAGYFIRHCTLSQPHSDSKKPDRPDTPPRSSPSDNSGSDNLEGSDTSKDSKISGPLLFYCTTITARVHQYRPLSLWY